MKPLDYALLWFLVMGIYPLADPGHDADTMLSFLDIMLHSAALGVLLARWKLVRRESPATGLASPDIVTTTMKPGKTTLRMVDDDGKVRVVVVLTHITTKFNGPTFVEFRDLTTLMEDREFWS